MSRAQRPPGDRARPDRPAADTRRRARSRGAAAPRGARSASAAGSSASATAAIAVGHIPAATLNTIDHRTFAAYTANGSSGGIAGVRRSFHTIRPAAMNSRPVPNHPARLRSGMPKYGPASCQRQKCTYCICGAAIDGSSTRSHAVSSHAASTTAHAVPSRRARCATIADASTNEAKPM